MRSCEYDLKRYGASRPVFRRTNTPEGLRPSARFLFETGGLAPFRFFYSAFTCATDSCGAYVPSMKSPIMDWISPAGMA